MNTKKIFYSFYCISNSIRMSGEDSLSASSINNMAGSSTASDGAVSAASTAASADGSAAGDAAASSEIDALDSVVPLQVIKH